MRDNPAYRYTRLAKDLHRAYDAGETRARQRIAAHRPQPEGTPLRHADFLHVIAQENSYPDWPSMKAAITALGEPRAAALQRLKIALAHGQTQVVKSLLTDMPDLAKGLFGLEVALYDLSAVTAALDADPTLATRSFGPRTALVHLCASKMFRVWPEKQADMFAIAEALLANGADVNGGVPAGDGTDHMLSPLYFALGHAGNLPLARWLLENGATPDDGESLYHATELGHREGVRLLLEFGASPANTNALPRAMDFDDADMVQLLLEGGANPNEFAESGDAPFVVPALHQAARRMSSPEIIDMLLEAGADPMREWRGKSVYVYASVYGNVPLQERLEALGAVCALTPEEQLMAKAARGEETVGAYIDPAKLSDEFRNLIREILHLPGKLDHIKRLVAIGLEYDRVEPVEKLTPVQVAGWCGLPEVMGYLLRLKPDLSHVNGYGGTLLSTIIHGSENCPERSERDHIACARLALEEGVALPKRAIDLAGDPAMRAFLADWAKAKPGQVTEGGVA